MSLLPHSVAHSSVGPPRSLVHGYTSTYRPLDREWQVPSKPVVTDSLFEVGRDPYDPKVEVDLVPVTEINSHNYKPTLTTTGTTQNGRLTIEFKVPK